MMKLKKKKKNIEKNPKTPRVYLTNPLHEITPKKGK